MTTSYLEAYQDHCNATYGAEDLVELERDLQTEFEDRQLAHASLDALASAAGYDIPGWTADELAIDLVQTAQALDGVDPVDLEPAVEAWLQRRKA